MKVFTRQQKPAAVPYSRNWGCGRIWLRRCNIGQTIAAVALALCAQCLVCGPAFAQASFANLGGVVMTRAEQIARGIEARPISGMTYVRSATAYGRVLDPKRLAALAARVASVRELREATAAVAVAARTARPRGAGTARAKVPVAWAKLRAVMDAARAEWGNTLAAEALKGSQVFTALASGQNALVELTVPGLGRVPAPAVLQLRPLDRAGKPIVGLLVSASPRSDPPAQGESFFYRIPVGRTLRPGLRVVAQLPLSKKRAQGVRIPKAAVVWRGDRGWVYVQAGPERFVRRPVPTDRPVPGGWFAAHGWKPGERVVVRGAQTLYSEQSRAEIARLASGGSFGG